MSGPDRPKDYTTPMESGGDKPRVREVARRFTYHDYLRLSGDERYEIIEGALVLAPSPSPLHQEISLRVGYLLHAYVTGRNLGKVFQAPLDVVLSDSDVVQPDVMFIARERLHVVRETHILGVPDLAVEVVSKSSLERDRGAKRRLYERYGVKEYWIVEPAQESIAVFSESYQVQRACAVADGPARISTLLPELVVDVPAVFR